MRIETDKEEAVEIKKSMIAFLPSMIYLYP